jgi:hypothetical protein
VNEQRQSRAMDRVRRQGAHRIGERGVRTSTREGVPTAAAIGRPRVRRDVRMLLCCRPGAHAYSGTPKDRMSLTVAHRKDALVKDDRKRRECQEFQSVE